MTVSGIVMLSTLVPDLPDGHFDGLWQEYVAAAAPLLFQGGEVEGTPAWQRLKLMAQYYWEVRRWRHTALPSLRPDPCFATQSPSNGKATAIDMNTELCCPIRRAEIQLYKYVL